ncbi:unnamed protein product [Blepharisma stoltei]|uniref:C3H1-type domain-containing protein n=1 Tax=Blepharisma stoltei TaxID=1481888 RepID=A0AAU9K3A6_9CILI|nr:unnamed protein product [Blepharisma stoltei]
MLAVNELPQHISFLQTYLVQPCTRQCHSQQTCLNYHSLSERRRSPFLSSGNLAYTAVMCHQLIQGKNCSKGDSCSSCHTFSELNYHPSKYKTTWCSQEDCRGPTLCADAHRDFEPLRIFQATPKAHSISTLVEKPEHLNLSYFKTQPCKITTPHNPKHCEFYHSNRDKRRLDHYSPDLCGDGEKEVCGNEACGKSHNRVEQLYHPEKYKTKFCTFFPYKTENCDYGNFCSFAHSEDDIKVELIHNYPRDHNFYLNHFKTVWCPFNAPHDKALCVYAHNWQDFRRKPNQVDYESLPCPNWKSSTFILSYEEGGCHNMMSCTRCHGWKEIEYHPRTYKTRSCTLGRNCPKMQDCPFYHSTKDRRIVDSSPFKEYPINSNYKSQTPHPQKCMLSPDPHQKIAQTPFCLNKPFSFGFIPTENVAAVNHINSTTDEFVLHRGIAARKGLSAEASSFNSENNANLDARVLQFLARHKLRHLKNMFVGVKWEDLGSVKLDGGYAELLSKALQEEKAEMEMADELFDHVFTKELKNEDLIINKNVWKMENPKKGNAPVTFSSFPTFSIW